MSISLPHLKIIKSIPHIPQKSNWDCGIACLTMAIKYLKPELEEEAIDNSIIENGLQDSVWTIDLAYLCKHLGIKHRFCTITLGVDSNYATESFYKEHLRVSFSEEEERVNSRFQEAQDKGVAVAKSSVDMQDIVDHVSTNQPAIALIDDNTLRPHLKKFDQHSTTCLSQFFSCFKCCMPRSQETNIVHEEFEDHQNTYWGHYVIVIGYDLCRQLIILHEPSAHGERVSCPFSEFDKARKAFGTDEDILFLFTA